MHMWVSQNLEEENNGCRNWFCPSIDDCIEADLKGVEFRPTKLEKFVISLEDWHFCQSKKKNIHSKVDKMHL